MINMHKRLFKVAVGEGRKDLSAFFVDCGNNKRDVIESIINEKK